MVLPATAAPKEDEIDFRRLFDLLLSGKWYVVATTILGLLIGAAYLVIEPPVFQTDGLVQVEEDKKGGEASGSSAISSLLLGTTVLTEAELQILKSRMVLDQVIDKMNLLVSTSPNYVPYIGPAYARWHKSSGLVQAPLGLSQYAWGGESIVVPNLEVSDNLVGKRLYLRAGKDGQFTLEYPKGKKFFDGKVGEPASGSDERGKVTLFVRELISNPGTGFDLLRRPRQTMIRSLGGALVVTEKGRQSGVINLSFQGTSPKFVTDVVNNIEEAYLRQNVERRSAEAAQSLVFLEDQLPKLKDQVVLAQSRLNQYQLTHGSVDVTKETELVLQNSVTLETNRLQLVQQREQALERFTPQHPSVKALDEQIRLLDDKLSKQKDATQKLPTTQQEILSLTRDLEVSNQLYTEMLNSVQQLRVSKAGTIGNVRIVDRAMPPLQPSAPKPALVIGLSLFLGFAVGFVGILIQVALLRGVDDPAEVEARLGITAYASIPYSSSQRRLNQDVAKGGALSLLAQVDGQDLAIEALRSLRNSLQFLLLESSNNVVMLTGPSPGLGKSFVSMNLAAVLALSDKRIVVVDADLRKGHLNRYLAMDSKPGVSDYVSGAATYEQIVRGSSIETLKMVATGSYPPNPSELLLHERFVELINRLSADFDYVLIDTPPVLPVADSAIVGRLAGCTLLVLKSAQHPMREIEECYRRLTQAGSNVRGMIFNQVGRTVGSYGYGGYGYSYNRYERY